MDAAIQDSPIPIAMIHTAPSLTLARQKLFAWDNEGASWLLANHLADLGHRSVAFLGNCSDDTNTANKEQALRSRLIRAATEQLEMDCQDWQWDQTPESILEWRAANQHVTAVIAWNENTGIAFLQTVASLGIAVPDELSVVAFDSTTNCEHSYPPLTAVHQPLEDMAFAAVDFLVDVIDGDPDDPPHTDFTPRHFPARLDIRASAARPAFILKAENL